MKEKKLYCVVVGNKNGDFCQDYIYMAKDEKEALYKFNKDSGHSSLLRISDESDVFKIDDYECIISLYKDGECIYINENCKYTLVDGNNLSDFYVKVNILGHTVIIGQFYCKFEMKNSRREVLGLCIDIDTFKPIYNKSLCYEDMKTQIIMEA